MDDKRLERIEDKLDKITDTLSQHSAIHARNTTSLEDHIRRTELLEEALKPIKQTDTVIRAGIKSIAVVSTILTILYTLIKISTGI
jgi:hypothetical protein